MNRTPRIRVSALAGFHPQASGPSCSACQSGCQLNVAGFTVAQIKSKFGELHFFYDGGDAYYRGAVDVAIQFSLKTCSYCGAPGKQVGGAWVSTLCSRHDGSGGAKTGG